MGQMAKNLVGTLCASDLKTVGDGVREGFSWCNQNFSSGRRFTSIPIWVRSKISDIGKF
jgi:hypothetical protein